MVDSVHDPSVFPLWVSWLDDYLEDEIFTYLYIRMN